MQHDVVENDTPLGMLIDELQANRLHKDSINAELKVVEAEIENLKLRIRQTMDVLGLESASGHDLSVVAKDTNLGQIEDIDSFYDFIRETDSLYFLERRVSQAAFREYLDMNGGELPPGLELFVKHDLSVRKKD
jgi:tRNA nucleotidyltransferase (CCA-adding enzyme)